MSGPAIAFVPFKPSMADELVAVWRKSKNRALAPYVDPNTVKAHKQFLLKTQSKRADLTIALAEDHIIGFMAQAAESIEQLYLHVDHQGSGLGSTFIEFAKVASPQRLHLYTFQRNLKARGFYQKHGFNEIGYGYQNMEGLADVELEWRAIPKVAPTVPTGT